MVTMIHTQHAFSRTSNVWRWLKQKEYINWHWVVYVYTSIEWDDFWFDWYGLSPTQFKVLFELLWRISMWLNESKNIYRNFQLFSKSLPTIFSSTKSLNILIYSRKRMNKHYFRYHFSYKIKCSMFNNFSTNDFSFEQNFWFVNQFLFIQ